MGPDRLLRAPADEDAQPRCNGANGLRMDRFYAGAQAAHRPAGVNWPNQRPHRRLSGGQSINKQEKVLSSAFRDAGYATAHFGKWHPNYSGVGLEHPLESGRPHNPGELGFDYWVSHTSGLTSSTLMAVALH